MELKRILNSIKTLLNGEELINDEVALETAEINSEIVDEARIVELETQMLDDEVTSIEAETFEAGQPVFIVVEEGDNVAMPIGNYMLADGRELIVEEEGIIASIGEPQTQEPDPEEEMEQETVSRVDFDEAIAALQATIDGLKAQLQLSETTLVERDSTIEQLNVELSKLPAVKKLTHSPEVLSWNEKFNKQQPSGKQTTFSKILDELNKTKK
jgi:hypothetical protein